MVRQHSRSTLFPTRRSSDLGAKMVDVFNGTVTIDSDGNIATRGNVHVGGNLQLEGAITITADRKSTRLNSSHTVISYAVFCLKKKKATARRQLLCQRHKSLR